MASMYGPLKVEMKKGAKGKIKKNLQQLLKVPR